MPLNQKIKIQTSQIKEKQITFSFYTFCFWVCYPMFLGAVNYFIIYLVNFIKVKVNWFMWAMMFRATDFGLITIIKVYDVIEFIRGLMKVKFYNFAIIV